MAFFDDLMQKTKGMTDVVKLNGMISDEEKLLNNTYTQIGKLYVNLHRENYEDAFAGMISAINEGEARVEAYRQQIMTIKGVVRCEKCGAEIPNNVSFCSGCGAPAPKPPMPTLAPNQMFCTGCGNVIDKSVRFCTICGKPTAAPQVRTCSNCGSVLQEGVAFCTECGQAAATSAPVPAPAPTVCPNCGAALEKGMAFCIECGTRVQ